ncbi:MAG: prephenate dehydrogenase/arogenate dehydrogenase family protein [Spirochaetota bacterium]
MKVGIYGLGRFGMFWSKLFAKTGKFEICAYNRTPRRAEELPEGVSPVSLNELCRCDVIFLCVAISSLEEVLTQMAPLVSSGTTVMDTCSVKVYPARLMEQILPHSVEFAATHPMFGPDSGRNGVEGLPLVFAPVGCSDRTATFWHRQFAELLGLRVISMSPDEHDREAAFTQGITHFVGRVLEKLELEPSEIGTEGYQGLLHIIAQTCNDPEQLFFDLQRYNPYTREMHAEVKAAIDDIMLRLDEADSSYPM